MSDLPSINDTIAPGSYKLHDLNFHTESGNILSLKKHDPASPEIQLCYRIGVRNVNSKVKERDNNEC